MTVPVKDEKGIDPTKGLDDGRENWDWKTKYPPEAKKLVDREARIAGVYLVACLLFTFLCAGFGPATWSFSARGFAFNVDVRLLAIFFTGCLGGTTFSIKWLMHSVAKGKWHEDRFYWRIFVPLVGGVYAVIVTNLFNGGFIGGGLPKGDTSMSTACALAFLIGYFSDGVSGLLTNVANAVFGTVEKNDGWHNPFKRDFTDLLEGCRNSRARVRRESVETVDATEAMGAGIRIVVAAMVK